MIIVNSDIAKHVALIADALIKRNNYIRSIHDTPLTYTNENMMQGKSLSHIVHPVLPIAVIAPKSNK